MDVEEANQLAPEKDDNGAYVLRRVAQAIEVPQRPNSDDDKWISEP